MHQTKTKAVDGNLEKALVLFEYMLENTDEKHTLTLKEIQSALMKKGIDISTETIRSYFATYRDILNMEVVVSSLGRYARYHMTEGLLQEQERRIIIDALNSSILVNEKKTHELVGKILKFGSKYEQEELMKTALAPSIAKSDAGKTWIRLDEISSAINEDKKISFRYGFYNAGKEIEYPDKVYEVSPFFFIWGYDRYYLYAYDDVSNKVKTFRVDKISNIKIMDCARTKTELIEKFNGKDASDYVCKRLAMYDGDIHAMTVEIEPKALGSFIDQFSKDGVIVEKTENGHLFIHFEAAVTSIFIGWLFGVGVYSVECDDDVKKIIEDYRVRCQKTILNKGTLSLYLMPEIKITKSFSTWASTIFSFSSLKK